LRHHEENEWSQPADQKLPLKDYQQLTAQEDYVLQNQLTHLVEVKPNQFRTSTLRFVLWAVYNLGRYYWNKGKLGGIPTIHFARWVLIDGGKRLLFFSNFDNNWESYLGDFVDKAAIGLTGVWSNCWGYPPTKNLIGEGATNADQFKNWARSHQLPTQVWYSAYPYISVRNESNNTLIRAGLYNDRMSPEALDTWLRTVSMQLNKSVRPKKPAMSEYEHPISGQLELEDIQGCIVWGYGELKASDYLILQFGDPAKTRKWLGKIADDIETAVDEGFEPEDQDDNLSRNIAFTYEGLKALGLNQATLDSFSQQFKGGMTGKHTQRVMGDSGKSAPEHWAWGGTQNPEVHATLLLYADTKARLKELTSEFEAALREHDIKVLHKMDARELPGRKEHFGFRDGISQPKLKGVFKAGSKKAKEHEPQFNTLNGGEFIFGYQDTYATTQSPSYPVTPTVAPKQDPHDILPKNIYRESEKDFGRNGSYLVFRTLQQDVKAFWEFLNEKSSHQYEERIRLASKMVGRWPSGAPMAIYPDADPIPELKEQETQDPKSPCNNDRFAYHRPKDKQGHDPYGEKCPFGSHLRRSNIRDDMEDVTPATSMKIGNQHRIIRRGRPYGSQDIDPTSPGFTPDQAPKEEVGLQFLCFNTNIQRQFEFIQSTWGNNPSFHTQINNPDPISGVFDPKDNGSNGVHNIQQCPVRHEVSDLKRFVHTRGGGYFFMPGIKAIKYLASLE
jgi:Dyp-type peroxidase family